MVGKKKVTATSEDSLAVSYKVKQGLTTRLSIATPWFIQLTLWSAQRAPKLYMNM